MKSVEKSELKKLMISSLDHDTETKSVASKLEEAGISYSFDSSFTEKVIGKLVVAKTGIRRELEFTRYMNTAFYRIALTGVAAIILIIISILFRDGSLSLNSLLGLSDNVDESIVCLLTGI